MPYEIKFDERVPDLIYVKFTGVRKDWDEWDQVREIVLDILRENQDTRYSILLDSREVTVMLKNTIAKFRQNMNHPPSNVRRIVVVSHSQYVHFVAGALRPMAKIFTGILVHVVYSPDEAYRIFEQDMVETSSDL